ncbi:Protein of unknown function [Gryllus bimaculatus]|nr:Protein of unknown function [Gryllus bimaculatus]
MSVYNTSEEQVCFEELRNEDITEISSGVCSIVDLSAVITLMKYSGTMFSCANRHPRRTLGQLAVRSTSSARLFTRPLRYLNPAQIRRRVFNVVLDRLGCTVGQISPSLGGTYKAR